MPRAYRVTPILRPGRSFYIASFRCASGKQVTRGLGTADLGFARSIAAGLERLWTTRAPSPSQAPGDIPAECLRLYFGQKLELAQPTTVPHSAAAQFAAMPEELARFVASLPTEKRIEAATLLAHYFGAGNDSHILRHERDQARAALEAERAAHQDLRASIIGRAARSAAEVPALPKAVELFERHIRSETTRDNAVCVLSVLNRFTKSLPADVKKPVDIRPAHIGAWLDSEAGQEKVTRRAHLRRRLARFVNWAARTWEYPSPMPQVPSVKKDALDRQRGGIKWHDLAEVERAVKAAPDAYWKALVATLGYAGLQLAELAWLRTSDLQQKGKTWELWIDTVEDAEDSTAVHKLKTGHRRRAVKVHPRYLLPLLKAHLKASTAGHSYLFPMPETVNGTTIRRRQRKVERGARERWIVRVLSKYLVGDKGCEHRKGRAGILPKGMTPRSLRRTFGSLLLRSGKTTAEVAAAMGNTESVVRTHYARILGAEVSVNF